MARRLADIAGRVGWLVAFALVAAYERRPRRRHARL
jgi:hypothetical protein